jgi:hypothetical protein
MLLPSRAAPGPRPSARRGAPLRRFPQLAPPCRALPSFGHGYDGLDSRRGKSAQPTQQDVPDAPSTVRSIIEVLADNDLDGLIPYIPDEVLDVILAQRKRNG